LPDCSKFVYYLPVIECATLLKELESDQGHHSSTSILPVAHAGHRYVFCLLLVNVVPKLDEALWYKLEGHRFDSQWSHGFFQLA
jgi:hypothetical protein